MLTVLGRTLAISLLLVVHSLLDDSQFLQLLGREHSLDLRAALLPDLHYFLLLLLHAKRVVVADSTDLLVLVLNYRGNPLLLVGRELQLVFNRRGSTLAARRTLACARRSLRSCSILSTWRI